MGVMNCYKKEGENLIKRPLLWMVIAFIVGIALHEQPMPLLIILAVAGILYAVFLCYFEKKQKTPCLDLFLFLLPFCFFVGNWCANSELQQMQEKEKNLNYVLLKGEEVYTAGTVKQIMRKKNEMYELLLENCIISSCDEIGLEQFFENVKEVSISFLKRETERKIDTKQSKIVNSDTESEQNEKLKQGEEIKQNEVKDGEVFFVGDLLVYISTTEWRNSSLRYGERVVCYGEASLFEQATNFGQFDAAGYYRQKGITGKVSGIRFWNSFDGETNGKTNEASCVYEEGSEYLTLLEARIPNVRLMGCFIENLQQCGNMLINGLYRCKEAVYEVLFTLFDEKDAGILSAMLLGEKAFLDTELKLLYQESGISHILAVSGLHVSLLGMAVYQFLRHTPVGRNGAICVACLFVFVYGLFTNFSISTERAVMMFFLSMFATLFGRTYDMPTALACSAAFTLIRQPLAIGSASFLLSYTAVIGVCLYQVLVKQLKEKFQFKFTFLETIGVSLCIQLVMLPVLLSFFYEISLYSIVLNCVVLPFAAVLLFSGIMTALVGGVSFVAGVFFSGAAKQILAWYEMVCNFANKLPFSLVLVGKPDVWQIVLYYILLLGCIVALVHWKKKRFFCMACMAGLLFFVPHDTENKLVFLDISQGDCMILQDKKEGTILIDCGSTDETQVGTYRLLPYLKAKRIATLEAVVVTHADADHINGIVELLEKMEPLSRWDALFYKGTVCIKRLLLPKLANPDAEYQKLERLAREKKIPIYYISAKEQLQFGDWKLVCLYPEKNMVSESKNNSSLVWYASCGEFSALFTGDVEKEGEQDILQSGFVETYGISEIDLLKVAHHGSKTSSSKEFLQAITPKLAVISCGKNNRYGHPHEEVVERLKQVGSEILSTTERGQITVMVERKQVIFLHENVYIAYTVK